MDTFKKIVAAAGSFIHKRWHRPSPVVLHRAAEEGDVQTILASLKDGIDSDEWIEDGVTPLHRAAESGHAEAAAVLLAGDATPDMYDRCVRTMPLHCAAKEGHTDGIRTLIAAGADRYGCR